MGCSSVPVRAIFRAHLEFLLEKGCYVFHKQTMTTKRQQGKVQFLDCHFFIFSIIATFC